MGFAVSVSKWFKPSCSGEISEVADFGSERASGEKSKMPFLTMSPAIFTGLESELRDSVKAMEVATGPLRKEP